MYTSSCIISATSINGRLIGYCLFNTNFLQESGSVQLALTWVEIYSSTLHHWPYHPYTFMIKKADRHSYSARLPCGYLGKKILSESLDHCYVIFIFKPIKKKLLTKELQEIGSSATQLEVSNTIGFGSQIDNGLTWVNYPHLWPPHFTQYKKPNTAR